MALTDKITAIANGFRASRGTTNKYSLDEMAILAAEPVGGSGSAVTKPLTVTANGTYEVPDGVDGYSPVTVNVSGGDTTPASNAAILEVAKSNCYVYSDIDSTCVNEDCVLLDIYPKTNGIVRVTYGDLTKTIMDTSGAEYPEPQQVFFGTFRRVTDDVETPDSGILYIEGDYRGYGIGSYTGDKNETFNCSCVAAVYVLGNIEVVPEDAFDGCTLVQIYIPEGVTRIGGYSFAHDSGEDALKHVYLPESLTSIGEGAFSNNCGLRSLSLPEGITSIDYGAFFGCNNLVISKFPSNLTTIGDSAFEECNSLEAYYIPSSVKSIGNRAFYAAYGAQTSLTFLGTPDFIDSEAFTSDLSRITTINVPWAEGGVANAPWGATNATINYNYVTEEEI